MQLNLTEEQKVRNQRIGKIVGDCLYFGFLGFLVALVLSFIITGKVSGKPNFLGYRHFYIASESMEPTIMTSQFVIAKTIDADDVEVDDIIAYKNNELSKIIIHRVIDIREDENGNRLFTFQGDNNENPDPYDVTENMIMYEVVLY